jgi:PAS domain-containing protein
MMSASRTRGEESETDVFMMDDVQFTASLDRLLDSELVNSAYNHNTTTTTITGQPQVVSTDPSVASTISSNRTRRQEQSHPQTTTTPPQKPFQHPSIPSTLLPPPNPVAMDPSAITQRLAFTMPPMTAPSNMVMSMSTSHHHEHHHHEHNNPGQKRAREASSLAISEDESERERRRQDRNQREQQRSRRITEQIAHLRDVLTQGGVPCRPDKNSTLISVAEYIQQLQARSNFLDGEHKKLLDTIARTNEMVNNQYYQAITTTADGTTTSSVSSTTNNVPAPVSNDLLSDGYTGGPLEDENAVLVQGLDYKSVFYKCGIALAVASIDGRFIDCNSEFVTLSGYSRTELLPGEELTNKITMEPNEVPSKSSPCEEPSPPRNLSLFNLLNREDMERVFSAMSGMLRRPVVRNPGATPQDSSPQLDCWSGSVRQNREEQKSVQLRMNITLVRTPGGRPKFFNCSLTTD